MSRRKLGALMLATGAGVAGAPLAARAASQAQAEIENSSLVSGAGVPAATNVLVRWIGAAAYNFDLELIPAVNGLDTYTVSAAAGRVSIKGSTPATIIAGFHEYLGRALNQSVSWNGSIIAVPSVYPDIAEFTVTANVARRFVTNDTEDGYAGAYRNLNEWKSLIDQYAMHGLNEVFMPVGSESVYFDTFQSYGYSKAEILAWIPQAAHQPWWLLQNMSGNLEDVTETQLNARAELGRAIIDYIHALGMRAVLPGYFGTVPPQFATKNSGAVVVAQGTWTTYSRPDWLDPTNSIFASVAADFYTHSATRLGTASMYKMDLLHEGGTAGAVNVSNAAKAVETALQTARPGAIWVLLGWVNNPSQLITSVVNKSTTFIVDGISERLLRNREADWNSVPYAFGAIWNFGGHTAIGGQLTLWNTRYFDFLGKTDTAMHGVALLPESSYNNPTAFEFMAELAWRTAAVDTAAWFATHIKRRYGVQDTNAEAAWEVMRQTAFGYTMADGVDTSETAEGLYGGTPSLTLTSIWGPSRQRYNMDIFATALPKLLLASDSVKATSTYKYDLMDVSRQVLSNLSRVLLPKIKTAYDAKNLTNFDNATTQWLTLMDQIDAITGTWHQTLLGAWIANARAEGATDAEKAANEKDVRSIITLWSPDVGSLNDYANREWNGLVGGYYKARWSAYFTHLRAGLTGIASTAPNWNDMGHDFVNGTGAYEPTGGYATTASGDITVLAGNVMVSFNAVKALP